MTRRNSVGIIYFLVVLMTLLLRVSGALDVYGAIGADADKYFTLVVQLLVFGAFPLVLYPLMTSSDELCPNCGQDRGRFWRAGADFGFKKFSGKDFGRTLVIALIMIFLTSGIAVVWNLVLYYMGYTFVSSSTDYGSVAVLFSELFFTALLPGVFEEITHRGLLFAGYRDSGRKVVFISALLFCLMHQNIRQTGYTFFDGVVIALVVYYSGSIYLGMIVHFLNNAVAVAGEYISQNGGAFEFVNKISDWFRGTFLGWISYVILAAALTFLMIFMFKRMRRDAVAGGRVPPVGVKENTGAPLSKDPMLWATVIVGAAATAFSLVWGILR